MAAGGPNHGTLEHRKLHVGREALVDGEKIRPYYLGTIAELGRKQESRGIEVLTKEADGASGGGK
jgi:hypothetical protein